MFDDDFKPRSFQSIPLSSKIAIALLFVLGLFSILFSEMEVMSYKDSQYYSIFVVIGVIDILLAVLTVFSYEMGVRFFAAKQLLWGFVLFFISAGFASFIYDFLPYYVICIVPFTYLGAMILSRDAFNAQTLDEQAGGGSTLTPENIKTISKEQRTLFIMGGLLLILSIIFLILTDTSIPLKARRFKLMSFPMLSSKSISALYCMVTGTAATVILYVATYLEQKPKIEIKILYGTLTIFGLYTLQYAIYAISMIEYYVLPLFYTIIQVTVLLSVIVALRRFSGRNGTVSTRTWKFFD